MPVGFEKDFCDSLTGLPGLEEPEALLASLGGTSPVSIRFNPYKVAAKPDGDPVPWCRYGFYLESRPQFTLDPLFHGGTYYVQETSSMFIEAIYRSIFAGDEQGLRILDLCAAPGGKTTLLSTLAGCENLVVANEPVRQRAFVLADNVKRWGIGNVMVTNNDPSHFGAFKNYFDLILVDAPCSGEGMFRKNPDARREWSGANIDLCAARSRRIIAESWEALRPGGVMIFSTCTFNRSENEDTVAWAVAELGAEGIDMDIDPDWGIVEGEEEGIKTFRFYPHKLRGEGFFAAVMRKREGKNNAKPPRARKELFAALAKNDIKAVGQWFGQPEMMRFYSIGDNIYGYYAGTLGDLMAVAGNLTAVYSGVPAGQLYHGKLKPEHALALFHDLNREKAAVAELGLEDALTYLRKGDLNAGVFTEGINLAVYQGAGLGWAKRIGARVNNMYPKELRIVHL